MSTELTLVLSGHVRRPQSADMRPFWLGFIELQKKLPATRPVGQITVHSWNPELAELVQLVYAPDVSTHEPQAFFYPEFLQAIDPPDRFEIGVDRLNSTWKSVTVQTVLGNARSRARAAQLMDKLPQQSGQVLITRWDLGQTGSKQVNRLVADASLPEEYLYLSYFSEVDEGYADMWLLGPWSMARRFGDFDAFSLQSIAGRNGYLAAFHDTGWPLARAKTAYEVAVTHPIGQRAHMAASKLIDCLQALTRGHGLIERVVRRLTGPIQRFLQQPPLTAENSCVPVSQNKPVVFPYFMGLNIHALLKYFILTEGMRENTRFLTYEDFDLAAQSGQLIKQQPIVLVVRDDDAAIERLKSESPLPLAAIYQLGADSVREHLAQSDQWIDTALATESPRDQLAAALKALGDSTSKLPVLIMPSVERYLRCADWYTLNALMKYIAWSGMPYIGLDCSARGKPHLDFPGMELVRGGGALSFDMAAGTAAGIVALVDSADVMLADTRIRADRMMIELPVMVKNANLF